MTGTEALEMPALVLDCDACSMKGTEACRDCVVTYILNRDGAVVFDAAEERALRSLKRAGLVPEVRYRARTG